MRTKGIASTSVTPTSVSGFNFFAGARSGNGMFWKESHGVWRQHQVSRGLRLLGQRTPTKLTPKHSPQNGGIFNWLPPEDTRGELS